MEETEKTIKRGYVHWTDADGITHKEPLYEHPDLFETADEKNQVQAAEAKVLNEQAEEYYEELETHMDNDLVIPVPPEGWIPPVDWTPPDPGAPIDSFDDPDEDSPETHPFMSLDITEPDSEE